VFDATHHNEPPPQPSWLTMLSDAWQQVVAASGLDGVTVGAGAAAAGMVVLVVLMALFRACTG
jgi:hypothetical protein